jgi:Zn-dependent peptidase ImmA (M78 family)
MKRARSGRRLPRGVKKWLTLDSVQGPVEVYFVPHLLDDKGDEMDGLFYPDDMLILIDKGLSPDKARSALLHEMMHLLFACAKAKHDILEKYEEEIVTFLEPLLFDVLRRNKFLRMP